MGHSFEKFTPLAKKVLTLAQEEAESQKISYIGTEHVLLGLLRAPDCEACKILNSMGVTEEKVRNHPALQVKTENKLVNQQIVPTSRVKKSIEDAFDEAKRMGQENVGTEHLLIGLLLAGDGMATSALKDLNVTLEAVRNAVDELQRQPAGGVPRASPEAPAAKKPTNTPVLDQYSRDLTLEAAAGRLDPVIGRESEIERVIQILSRRTKNNPALIGEPGVGKTAIAEGLAQRIILNDVPEQILNARCLSLDLGSLVAGTKYRGEFEERIKKVMEEVRLANAKSSSIEDRKKGQSKIILFIDELHTLVGAGAAEGAIDASNILKPALARGEIQCIGATTLSEYRKYIEKDAALERRFQPVMVEPPSIAQSLDILHGVKALYEKHHKVRITDAAVKAAVVLSDRHISNRVLPDKAIDLIDEGAARVRLKLAIPTDSLKALESSLKAMIRQKESAQARKDEPAAEEFRIKEQALREQYASENTIWHKSMEGLVPEVGEEAIAEIVSSWTKIPVTRLVEEEVSRLLRMEEELHTRVVGQDEAVIAISQAVRRSRAGLKDPRRPIGSFIFLGPTGVGKTELAKALATVLFDTEDAMIRLDMSEFMERHTTARLVGSPPGYVGYDEGGQLTEAVRRKPYSVILLDEIEKAHPEVFNMLLQILEDGRLSDAKGKIVNFSNCIIIMTSNLGVRDLSQSQTSLGFQAAAATEADEDARRHKQMKSKVEEELKRMFRPEFLNRLDGVVTFKSLTNEQIREIVDLMLERTTNHLAEQDVFLDVSVAAKDWLAEKGFDKVYGARPLRRVITQRIEDPLSEDLLRGKFSHGDTIKVDVEGEGLVLTPQPRTKEQVSVGSSNSMEV